MPDRCHGGSHANGPANEYRVVTPGEGEPAVPTRWGGAGKILPHWKGCSCYESAQWMPGFRLSLRSCPTSALPIGWGPAFGHRAGCAGKTVRLFRVVEHAIHSRRTVLRDACNARRKPHRCSHRLQAVTAQLRMTQCL